LLLVSNCLYCNNSLKPRAKFCPNCGKPIVRNTKNCPNCNKTLALAAKFCSSCGHRFIQTGNTTLKQVKTKEGKTSICAICRGEIKVDLTACPECNNLFHYNHLANWLISETGEGKCPICKVELDLINV